MPMGEASHAPFGSTAPTPLVPDGRARVALVERHLLIVTGGSSGIGRAFLEATPLEDVRTIEVSRRGTPGVTAWSFDLADPASWPALCERLEDEVADFAGDHAWLVHSAGTLEPIGFAGEVPAEAYRRNVLLNAAAPQVLGDAFLRGLARTEARGTVLMISSGAASSAYPGWSGYCAGKAAVDQWVRTVGVEQDRRGGRCRVLAVAPGVVATAMQEQIRETDARDFPDVARFVALHEEGALRDPAAVAKDLWRLLQEGTFENGAVPDLRDG